MVPRFQHSSIFGPALASLLTSTLSRARRPCDGLLYGSVQTSHRLKDDGDGDASSMTREECYATISAAICNASTCSFYDQAGNLDEAKLLSLQPPATTTTSSSSPLTTYRPQLLGWLSYRSGAPLQPSMREMAVCRELLRRTSSSSGPVLLLLVGSSTDQGCATLSLDYRLFQASLKNGRVSLEPLELTVSNLSESEMGRGKGMPGMPSHQLPVVSDPPTQGSSTMVAMAKAAGEGAITLEGCVQGLLVDLASVVSTSSGSGLRSSVI